MEVGIVGGGIAGLAAALAFRQIGHRVTVFEQAPAFTEVGAGIRLAAERINLFALAGGAWHSAATVVTATAGHRP